MTPLYEMNADEARPPASMAKMMTEYIVLSKIKSGAINWDNQVTISKHAASIPGSGGKLAAGETYTVEQLYEAVAIDSANDGATALAEYLSGGDLEKFAQLMNDTAKKIGLSDKTYFIDPTGLDRVDLQGYDPQSLPGETAMSARDAAILAAHIVNEHPEALKYSSTPVAYLKPGNESYRMQNWDWMLGAWKGREDAPNFQKYAYDGLDGLKTGHTDRAGENFTGTAQRDGFRLISVVMGTKSESKRFTETRKLLDYGFNNFTKKMVVTAKQELPDVKTVPVKKGVGLQVPVVTGKGLELVVPKNVKDDQFVIKTEPKPADQIVAPIKAGDVVGKVTVTYGKQAYTIDLVASEDVQKAGWFRLMMRGIGHFFKGLFGDIKNLF